MAEVDSPTPTMKELREAIPQHCFKASNLVSFSYIVRDLILAGALGYLAYHIQYVDSLVVRTLLWAAYTVAQGMVMTGIWIIAHECGHQALFSTRLLNDSLGFILHSMLLVPFFSWKFSHGLHHRYTNHLEKDTAFVPYRQDEKPQASGWLEMFHMTEDTPALNFLLLCMHQLFGFPAYLLFMVSAGAGSLPRANKKNESSRLSHFDPGSDIFTLKQHPFILLSDIGLGLTLTALYFLGRSIGFWTVALMYFVPYLWVNHWIVAITYLHHTHPSGLHFEADTWNFRDGALSTVDRDFGFVGKHIFHGIIEFHVVHHLFTHIPFYHAEEATKHISRVLGPKYLRVETSFLADLWKTFTTCRYVEPSKTNKGILVWSSS